MPPDTPSSRRIVGLAAGQQPWRILAVDDEPTNRLIVTELLDDMGFTVREAQDGGAALNLIADWRPHLVVLDMQMPEIDGWQVLAALRGSPLRKGVVVVACTGISIPDEWRKLREAGADDHLSKPFRLDELLQIIGRFLPVQWQYAS